MLCSTGHTALELTRLNCDITWQGHIGTASELSLASKDGAMYHVLGAYPW